MAGERADSRDPLELVLYNGELIHRCCRDLAELQEREAAAKVQAKVPGASNRNIEHQATLRGGAANEVPMNNSAVIERNGRFFIALGFAGFNLAANQVRGYKTAQAALKAHVRCGGGR